MSVMQPIGNYTPIQPQYGSAPAVWRDSVTTSIFGGMPQITASVRRSGSGLANRVTMKLHTPLWNSVTASFTDKCLASVDLVFPDTTNSSDRENLKTSLVAFLNSAVCADMVSNLIPPTM